MTGPLELPMPLRAPAEKTDPVSLKERRWDWRMCRTASFCLRLYSSRLAFATPSSESSTMRRCEKSKSYLSKAPLSQCKVPCSVFMHSAGWEGVAHVF